MTRLFDGAFSTPTVLMVDNSLRNNSRQFSQRLYPDDDIYRVKAKALFFKLYLTSTSVRYLKGICGDESTFCYEYLILFLRVQVLADKNSSWMGTKIVIFGLS